MGGGLNFWRLIVLLIIIIVIFLGGGGRRILWYVSVLMSLYSDKDQSTLVVRKVCMVQFHAWVPRANFTRNRFGPY